MIQGVLTPIAVGELIDKITILEIKSERLTDTAKLRNVQSELGLLVAHRQAVLGDVGMLFALAARLKEVNGRIWDLEDAIRNCERNGDFGEAFVATARAIYRRNDERAALKREINEISGSNIIEEKSYAKY
jgi:hypothetical protein